MRHGFPYQPSAMAFDPVQKILAIGTQNGALRLYPFPKKAAAARRPSQPGTSSLGGGDCHPGARLLRYEAAGSCEGQASRARFPQHPACGVFATSWVVC
ncbi:syntaxin-binding protein 5 isoform X7 [Arapaima gigas]